MQSIRNRVRKALPDQLVAVMHHARHHRVIPNLINPRTFNEKVLHRIVFGRDPWMAMVADKYRVRDYVNQQVGADLLPRLHFVTADPGTIPFASLPQRFVVKPTHGSGWVEIVRDKKSMDEAALVKTFEDWLSQSYYEITREWIYKDIPPRILVEEFIDDGNGGAPNDYKLFVFDGRVAFILVTMGRFDLRAHLMLDRNWNPVDVSVAYSNLRRSVPPPHLRQMIEAAETLVYGTDFMRVDFYDTPDKLYFGELTSTPGCGLDRFEPASFDARLGALWTLNHRAGKQRFSPAMTPVET